MTVRLANGSSNVRPIALEVGGVRTAAQDADTLPRSWDNWETRTFKVTVEGPGPRTVAICQATDAGAPNVDAVAIHEVGAAPEFFPVENGAPVFDTADAAFVVDENATDDVAVLSATDPNDDPVTYTLSGDDAGAFSIDASGALSFAAPPDAEAPTDSGGGNDYEVTVEASDGAATTPRAVTVTVQNVDEPATAITLTPVAVDENDPGAVVANIAVSDPDTTYEAGDLTVSDSCFVVTGGPGALQLALAPDEALDAEGAIPTVTVSAGGASSAPFTPTVNDVDEGGPVPVLFDAASVAGYSSQDKPGTGAGVSVSAGGAALTLDGNLWKRVPLGQDYAITENTRIELDLTIGAAVPEIVGVGFGADENPFNGNQALYQLGGTQSPGSFIDLRGSGEGGRFVVDLSGQAGKTISSLVFIADDDFAGDGLGSATFANVRLVEATDDGGNAAPRVVGGGVADLSVNEGASLEVDLPFVDDDGEVLSFDLAVTDAEGNPVPVDGLLSITDGVLSGTVPDAPGTCTVTVGATDTGGSGTRVESAFTLTVENVNEAPEAADPALEPYFGTPGQPIDGIDLAQFAGFFTDPDGDALTLSAEDLPAGLSVNGEGVIVGTPTGGGQVTATIRATDPSGASATLAILFDIDGADLGDTVVVEAEDFAGLGAATNLYATGTSGASGGQIVRAANGSGPGAVTTDLTQNGLIEGWYRVAMTRYDETDGSATYSLSVGDAVLAENEALMASGTGGLGDGGVGDGGDDGLGVGGVGVEAAAGP